MNQTCYHGTCGVNQNIDLILLAFQLDYHNFKGTLVDAQIIRKGEGVMFFLSHDTGFLEVEDNELFIEKNQNQFIGQYMELYFDTPPKFVEAFKDVYKLDHPNGEKLVSCGERLLSAYQKAADLRPSQELAKQQKKLEDAAAEAMRLADADEKGELNPSNTRTLSVGEVSGELPEQAVVGLQEHLKDDAIAAIGRGDIVIR